MFARDEFGTSLVEGDVSDRIVNVSETITKNSWNRKMNVGNRKDVGEEIELGHVI